jgi:hypothetical protein
VARHHHPPQAAIEILQDGKMRGVWQRQAGHAVINHTAINTRPLQQKHITAASSLLHHHCCIITAA